MKTLIIILNEDGQLAALAQQLQGLLPEHFELQTIASQGELTAQLSKAPSNAIVISAMTAPAFVETYRGTSPACSFVTALKNPPSAKEVLCATETLFLTIPSDDTHVAAIIASAAQQSALRAKLQLGNNRDEVNNLLSRPYFMHRLSEEISVSRRHKAPLCCVILSINYYRMYLDSYGYQFTNALLRFVGEEINRQIRYEDQVARVGDDELALLLSRCSEADAKRLIQRLAETLNSLTFQFEQYEEEISVCAGVAAYPFADSPEATPDMLVRYAHHALHQAKTSDEESHCVSLFSEIKPKL